MKIGLKIQGRNYTILRIGQDDFVHIRPYTVLQAFILAKIVSSRFDPVVVCYGFLVIGSRKDPGIQSTTTSQHKATTSEHIALS